MAEPPENGVRMVVFLTEVDFKTQQYKSMLQVLLQNKLFLTSDKHFK